MSDTAPATTSLCVHRHTSHIQHSQSQHPQAMWAPPTYCYAVPQSLFRPVPVALNWCPYRREWLRNIWCQRRCLVERESHRCWCRRHFGRELLCFHRPRQLYLQHKIQRNMQICHVFRHQQLQKQDRFILCVLPNLMQYMLGLLRKNKKML